MFNPLCEVKDISKQFILPHGQSLLAIQGVNLSLYPNEIVAIIGPSGCGKSTLLRILAGLIEPTSGEIFYHHQKQEWILPNTAVVFQNFALYPWMTVKENIEMVLKAIGMGIKEREKKVSDAITLTGLTGFEESYPRELSGGMKQRVGIARALVTDPEILLMDEPFSSVDALTAESLRSEFLNIFAERKTRLSSILLVSHDVREVAFMADKIIVMTPPPGQVYKVIENKIPRPRDYHGKEFLELVDQLYDCYHYKEGFEGKEGLLPLPAIGNGDIYSLLTYLLRRGGSEIHSKIVGEGLLTLQKFNLVLEGARLLNFVKVEGKSISLTVTGKLYANSSTETRPALWKEGMLTIPLFIKLQDLVKKSKTQSLEKEEVLAFLVKELPHQDAHLQFTNIVRWTHAGNLFKYNKKTKQLIFV